MILHSQILGEGDPLLILHGFLGMSDNWRSHGRKFAQDGFQVHLIDQRNHGRSFHDDAFNYDLLAADLYRYCQEHDLDRVNILGHSMGGKTAMQFATLYPHRVERLLVADIAPKYYPQHHQHILKGLASLDFNVIKSRNAAEEVLARYISDFGIRQFLLKSLYWKEKGELALRFNFKVLSKNIEEVGKGLLPEARYNGPVLFLAGERSGYVEPTDDTLISTHFPLATIDYVTGAGHWLHAENPVEFYDKALAFYQTKTARS